MADIQRSSLLEMRETPVDLRFSFLAAQEKKKPVSRQSTKRKKNRDTFGKVNEEERKEEDEFAKADEESDSCFEEYHKDE
jgi:hypothetical protein